MLLGKRPRAPMRRTTSMTLLGSDWSVDSPEGNVSSAEGPIHGSSARSGVSRAARRNAAVAMAETAYFLQECCLCKRRLGHGRDIYMYRGDSAFCSVECRQQQIVIDERKEKCSVMAMKKESVSTSESQGSGSENVQTGTVAAG